MSNTIVDNQTQYRAVPTILKCYVYLFIYDKSDRAFDDLCMMTTMITDKHQLILSPGKSVIDISKVSVDIDMKTLSMLNRLDRSVLSNAWYNSHPQENDAYVVKGQITSRSVKEALRSAFNPYYWLECSHLAKGTDLDSSIIYMKNFSKDSQKSFSIPDVSTGSADSKYPRLVDICNCPDQEDLVDLSPLNEETNVNDVQNKYYVCDKSETNEYGFSKTYIILIEKDKDFSFSIGLLKLDKGLYENIGRDKMSPREFMTSVASITGDALWSIKFMNECIVYA